MPVIARETLTPTLWSELLPLMEANHQAANVAGPFAPDPWIFANLRPWLWVVRDDGRPVGYCAHIISPNPVTQQNWATCAAIYLDPAHRHRARALVRQVEQDLAGEAVVVTYSVPHLSKAGAFFETVMEYQCMELVMGKRLAE